MCGIAGIVDFRGSPDVREETLERMCALLAHRGPNHQGIRIAAGAGLGHRRLAITDLVTGQQPLANEDGTVWVVFNGEIYNHRALRTRLQALGHEFVTRTDTEVLPHLYEEYGDDFVSHMEGSWALGLWDERRRRLLLTRDRLGEKPLVWTASGGVVRFASEAKALFADPAVTRDVDPRGLLDVLTYGHVTEEHTMFPGLSMALPASLLVFEDGRLVSKRQYWDVADVPPFEGSLDAALEELEATLSEVTRERLMGDVPYGLMLSGGIDSPLVGSFLVEHEPTLATFTVARRDGEDETAGAASVARHLGTDHTVIELADADPAAIAARIPWMLDQPFANDATIANYLLARTIRSELTVAITGDGGDHAFSGTMRHLGDAVAAAAGRAPRPLVAAAGAAVAFGARVTRQRAVLRRARHVFRTAELEERQRWLALNQQNLPIGNRELLTGTWRASANGYDPNAAPLAYYDRCDAEDHLNRVLYAELRALLPPNDLLKVDRAFMYNGVAGRAPFLDRRVVEFAASLPAGWKRRGLSFKWILRELARRRLPPQVAGRRKVGLAVPLREWLRGPLGRRVEGVLRSSSFARRGVFQPGAALRALEAHRSGRADHGHAVWAMTMTELWYRTFIDSFGEPDERVWE